MHLANPWSGLHQDDGELNNKQIGRVYLCTLDKTRHCVSCFVLVCGQWITENRYNCNLT